MDAVGWKCACTHLSVSSADFSHKFENVVRNNAKKCLFTIVQPMQTAIWKGRATSYISVAITELFKINRCCVFVFLLLFHVNCTTK